MSLPKCDGCMDYGAEMFKDLSVGLEVIEWLMKK